MCEAEEGKISWVQVAWVLWDMDDSDLDIGSHTRRNRAKTVPAGVPVCNMCMPTTLQRPLIHSVPTMLLTVAP